MFAEHIIYKGSIFKCDPMASNKGHMEKNKKNDYGSGNLRHPNDNDRAEAGGYVSDAGSSSYSQWDPASPSSRPE